MLLPPALASASRFGHAVFVVRTARSCSWGQGPNMESARANRTKYRASSFRNRLVNLAPVFQLYNIFHAAAAEIRTLGADHGYGGVKTGGGATC